MAKLNVDKLISRLLNVGERRLTVEVSQIELEQLCGMVRDVFMSQPVFVEVEAPISVCGDLHGQYSDLLRIFSRNGFPSDTNYMFLGDYVDRGQQSIEVISLLFAYKVKYPQNFFLLRGNHECSRINSSYGFLAEIERRYKNIKLWQDFQEVFKAMPRAGLIGGRILCMHGGISPELSSLSQLREMKRLDEPLDSLSEDLLWADPNPLGKGWGPNSRGTSVTFGTDIVEEMCRKLDIDLIARAHQLVQAGYEFCADRRCVTIFSAPNYCGIYNNSGAAMLVDKDLCCSFNIFQPRRE